jgi:hypothetical protein
VGWFLQVKGGLVLQVKGGLVLQVKGGLVLQVKGGLGRFPSTRSLRILVFLIAIGST